MLALPLLPEDPVPTAFAKLLIEDPYKVPVKKGKGKKKDRARSQSSQNSSTDRITVDGESEGPPQGAERERHPRMLSRPPLLRCLSV